jgi:hypothetical protein
MALLFRILGAVLGAVIVAIQFLKVLESPSRLLVISLAAAVIVCFVIAEIFLKYEERARERRQEEKNRQLVHSVVAEYTAPTKVAITVPVSNANELGMSADDPRVYVEIERVTDALRGTPFILQNHAKDVAHTVCVHAFKLDHKIVTFPSIEIIAAGKSAGINPTIERAGAFNQHNILQWLLKDWNANGELVEEWPIPLKVTYSDFSKQKKFLTSMTLVFHPIRYILEENHEGAWPGHDRVLWEFRDIQIKRVT